MGALERGERSPSLELLEKIASTMGVPYDWLANGDPFQSRESKPPKDDDVPSDPAQAVNPQLFLSLVLARSPAISKDMMATMLTVPFTAMDAILAGMPVNFDPRWGKVFSVLAQTLDLDTLRQDLRNLDVFLAREQATKKNADLLCALQGHAAKAGAYKVTGINGQEPDAVPTHIPYTDILMYGGGEHGYTWYFKCLGPVEDSSPQDIVGSMDELAERCGYKVSIVVTSEASYRALCGYCERLESNADACDMIGAASRLPYNVSVIYYDEATNVIDEWEFPEPEIVP